jgi:hypothetical protein
MQSQLDLKYIVLNIIRTPMQDYNDIDGPFLDGISTELGHQEVTSASASPNIRTRFENV